MYMSLNEVNAKIHFNNDEEVFLLSFELALLKKIVNFLFPLNVFFQWNEKKWCTTLNSFFLFANFQKRCFRLVSLRRYSLKPECFSRKRFHKILLFLSQWISNQLILFSIFASSDSACAIFSSSYIGALLMLDLMDFELKKIVHWKKTQPSN